MKTRRRLVRLVALTIVASIPMLGLSGVASATKVKAGPNCSKHPHKAKCAPGGGGGSGGAGGTPPDIIVSVSPNPVQETAESTLVAVVQVETRPIFAGQTVDISSDQLSNACAFIQWFNVNATAPGVAVTGVVLDNDGNATVFLQGYDCTPGSDLIEADLETAPYTTATTTLTVNPPQVTAYPTITGSPNPEVETGDGGLSGPESEVYAVFLVEENPVYAEQTVDVTSSELFDRCAVGLFMSFSRTGPLLANGITVTLDNDGNAEVLFLGFSCAAGPSTVTADLLAGTHDTFTTVYTISPPAVTDI